MFIFVDLGLVSYVVFDPGLFLNFFDPGLFSMSVLIRGLLLIFVCPGTVAFFCFVRRLFRILDSGLFGFASYRDPFYFLIRACLILV